MMMWKRRNKNDEMFSIIDLKIQRKCLQQPAGGGEEVVLNLKYAKSVKACQAEY